MGYVLADPIADLRSPSGSLVSMYIDRPSPGGIPALVSDLLKPVREAAKASGRLVEKSVRRDVERIHELASDLEVDPAPAHAIFASSVDDLFVVKSLTQAVPAESTLGPRPYLRPLRAMPRPMRAGVLVADRTQARAFVASAGLIEELGPKLEADIGKSNYGGFSGYDEHGVRARAEEATSRIWKSAVQRLLDAHTERPVDFVAIGGHEETVEEIGRTLHPYLATLHRVTFVAAPQTLSHAMLRVELSELAKDVRRARQAALAGRVCDTAWSGGQAVLGLSAVIDSTNAGAVDTLVVAGPFRRPGSMCNECGHLSRTETTCAVCGHHMFSVGDIVGPVMDAVVGAGGSIHQIDVASPLDSDGIGALTRFTVVG